MIPDPSPLRFWLVWLWTMLWLTADPLAAAPLTLAGGKVDLASHLEVLVEPPGTWTIADVARGSAGAFKPFKDQPLAGFFNRPPLWFRFTWLGNGPDSEDAWLEIAPAYLDDVRLYIPRSDGNFEERRSGQDWSWEPRDLDYRQPLFRLSLTPGLASYYVRLGSNALSSPVLTLWQPLAFMESAMAEARIWGVYFGVYALITLFNAFYWMRTQERIQYLFTLNVAMTLLVNLLAGGWLQQAQTTFWIPGLAKGVMASLICLSLPVMLRFILVYPGLLAQAPFWRRLLVWTANTLAGVGLVMTLIQHEELAMSLLPLLTLAYLLGTLTLAMVPAWRGSERARLILLAFGLYGMGLAIELGRHLGWLAQGLVTENAFATGSLAQALIISLSFLSDHKKLRREKAEADAQAAAERHLREEQQDFLALVSHEVLTPLSIIDAAVHNLLLDPDLDDKGRQRGEKIRRASQRLSRLMNDYLSAERLASADAPLMRVLTDLNGLCQAAIQDVEGTPGPEIRLTATALPPCPCDPDLVRLAIRNLLQNARRHSPSDQPVQIFLEARDQGIAIHVHDSGPGILPEDLPNIFKRFHRGHNTLEPGAGLGLYLVDKVVRRHGGWVQVRNLDKRGCDFCLWLPLREIAADL